MGSDPDTGPGMPTDAARWLVLLYQFPAGPDSPRVKIWRRLQSIGAVAIKNSVYVLPCNEQSREDFVWLLTELKACSADGAILESRFVDGMSDAQLKEQFNAARDADYAELLDEIEGAIATLGAGSDGDAAAIDGARRMLARARKRQNEIEAIDFFGADMHDATAFATQKLATELARASGNTDRLERNRMTTPEIQALTGRTWVTRRGVRVDRIASAWLIRRWIDADASFKFVDGAGYVPEAGEIRFDMFEAEFTHEGDLCTFEVLGRLVAEDDTALGSIGEIVHDIDLKDGKFGRPETAGISTLLDGIVAATDDDTARIEQGMMLFDGLYRSFSESPG